MVKDFTTGELQTLTLRMRYNVDDTLSPPDLRSNRPSFFDSTFSLMSLQQAIDLLLSLNKKYPHVNKIGMNIELKQVDEYLEIFGIDVRERLQ